MFKANKAPRRKDSTAIATVYACESAKEAHKPRRTVAERFHNSQAKLLERPNAGIKRHIHGVGILPNGANVTRLVGAMLLAAERRMRPEPPIPAA